MRITRHAQVATQFPTCTNAEEAATNIERLDTNECSVGLKFMLRLSNAVVAYVSDFHTHTMSLRRQGLPLLAPWVIVMLMSGRRRASKAFRPTIIVCVAMSTMVFTSDMVFGEQLFSSYVWSVAFLGLCAYVPYKVCDIAPSARF